MDEQAKQYVWTLKGIRKGQKTGFFRGSMPAVGQVVSAAEYRRFTDVLASKTNDPATLLLQYDYLRRDPARFQAATVGGRPEEREANGKVPRPQAATSESGRPEDASKAEKCDDVDEGDVDDEAAAEISHEAKGLLVHPVLPHLNLPLPHKSKIPPSPDPLPALNDTSPTLHPCKSLGFGHPATAADQGEEGRADEVEEVVKAKRRKLSTVMHEDVRVCTPGASCYLGRTP